MNALAMTRALPVATAPDFDFDDHRLRIFTHVPAHDHGIVALRGIVVVYDTQALHYEGVTEGAYYVRESQYTPAGMSWESWLQAEWQTRDRRVSPYSRLTSRREVVQAIHWPRPDSWALRLASGAVDGPYIDGLFGFDLIGKVVGIYRPA